MLHLVANMRILERRLVDTLARSRKELPGASRVWCRIRGRCGGGRSASEATGFGLATSLTFNGGRE